MDLFRVSSHAFSEVLKVKWDIILYSKGVIIFLWKILKNLYLQKWDINSLFCPGAADCTLYQHTTIATEFFISSKSICQKELKQEFTLFVSINSPATLQLRFHSENIFYFQFFTKIISEDWKLACGIHTQGSTAVNDSKSADVVVCPPG